MDDFLINASTWVVLGAVLCILEVFVPGGFLLWLGVGALATGILLGIFDLSHLPYILMVFGLCTLISVALGLFAQKRKKETHVPVVNTGLSAYVGRSATVLRVDGGLRIAVDDSSYPATCVPGVQLKVGDTVHIVQVTPDRAFLVEPVGRTYSENL
ncbi:NfeD family protein [Castellaniella sp.]|uniref:NfeD family protein n=1 Tax=Castellaniella sp. TaxID=1955812 RepID=UPI002AFE7DA2|nr:NfeD family protein [Castellaniella sp.]